LHYFFLIFVAINRLRHFGTKTTMQARQCDIQSTKADGIGKTVKVARQNRKNGIGQDQS